MAHLIKAAEKRQKEAIREKARLEQQRKEELERKQKEEASRLEKLQKEQEERMKNQLFMNQTEMALAPQPQPQAQFIMPGTAVQPTYQVVNPYAGNHNYQPVPVVYEPATYGVQYDENWQTPEQNLLYTPINPLAGTNDSARTAQKPNSGKVIPYEGNDTISKMV